ncbi:MAG: di-trans,poly-cis-decaprenylcistransferase [Nitrosopumilaceae archaeon]|nr:di-trans,poly-cis-decaprenylcistransferase [Nitrosopumilaceae archaeon]
MGRARDALLRYSGLYNIYARRLERETRHGDIPGHIAVILDGNRRWAKRQIMAERAGHFRGADAVENLLDWCEELGIRIITLYVLSAENLSRKDAELEYLYELIEARLRKLYDDPRIHRNRMRVRAIGRTEMLPRTIREIISKLDEATSGYDRRYLNVAMAYGGQNELVDAVKKIGARIRDDRLDVDDITAAHIEENLYTSYLPQPSPDMVLRTSGEKRLSGFLLWQSAYSELVFMDIMWPEFRKIDLLRAVRIYQRRRRRMGR